MSRWRMNTRGTRSISAIHPWCGTVELWEHVPEVRWPFLIILILASLHNGGLLIYRAYAGIWNTQTAALATVECLCLASCYLVHQWTSMPASIRRRTCAFQSVFYHIGPLIALVVNAQVCFCLPKCLKLKKNVRNQHAHVNLKLHL